MAYKIDGHAKKATGCYTLLEWLKLKDNKIQGPQKGLLPQSQLFSAL